MNWIDAWKAEILEVVVKYYNLHTGSCLRTYRMEIQITETLKFKVFCNCHERSPTRFQIMYALVEIIHLMNVQPLFVIQLTTSNA